MRTEGTVVAILATEDRNGFLSRQIILKTEENPQYPQEVSFQFVKDKCDLLNQFQLGEKVAIEWNLQGRKWTNPQGVDTWFNTLQGWRIDRLQAQQPQYQQQPQQNSGFPPAYNAPQGFTQQPQNNFQQPQQPGQGFTQQGQGNEGLPF